jgi:single-stranded DNA-binding protein
MSIRNNIRLNGNIGAILYSPESAKDNRPLKFVLVVNDYWKDAEGDTHSHANPIICTVFGAQGYNLSEHCDIGTELHISGRLRVTQNEGRYFTEVVIEEYTYGRRPKSQTEDKASTKKSKRSAEDEALEQAMNSSKKTKVAASSKRKSVPDFDQDDEE